MIIQGIKENVATLTFTKNTTPSGKFFFRISKDGLVLATSRKFSTELMLAKGINQILKYVPAAETLDFSENEFAFPDAKDVFADAE
jgi:hypothetical protein